MNGPEHQPPSKRQARKDDEISLKELILKIKEWGKYLLSKWKIIVLAGVIGAGLGLLLAIIRPVKYKAMLTFIVSDNSNSGGLSSYAGLASQFGINLGGGGGDIFQGDNIIQFLQSKLMIGNALMTTADFDGTKKTLADDFLDWSGWRDKWKENPELKGVHFPPGLSPEKFTLRQNRAMGLIYKDIVKNKLDINKPDKSLSFIQVTCTAKDELFSKIFTERLVKQATEFYVNTKTKQSKESVDKLQEQSDSVLNLLNKKTVAAAATQDMNLNPARSITGVPAQMAARDQSILMATYGEIVKNLNIAKISLVQQTPIIQVVDVPRLPLEKVKLGKLKGLIIGGFIFGFLAVLMLTVKNIYREVME